MSIDRAVFAPVERLALVLRPFRWHLLSFSFGLFGVVSLLALLGYLGQSSLFLSLVTPRLGAPIVVTFITWGWGAFLLATWFSPGRPRSRASGTSALARAGAMFGLLFRLWALFVLALFFLGPVFLWLSLWHVLR